jgi:hypothetical protein
LGPDHNHSDEQRQRGQCGGFFHERTDHHTPPSYRTKKEHSSLSVPESSHPSSLAISIKALIAVPHRARNQVPCIESVGLVYKVRCVAGGYRRRTLLCHCCMTRLLSSVGPSATALP